MIFKSTLEKIPPLAAFTERLIHNISWKCSVLNFETQIYSDFNLLSVWKPFRFFLLLHDFVLFMALNFCFPSVPLLISHQSPPQTEDSAGVWQELLRRALLWVPLRSYRDPRWTLWVLPAYWPFLWRKESRPGYVNGTFHVDQVHQWRRAGRPRLPHQIHLHRWWGGAASRAVTIIMFPAKHFVSRLPRKFQIFPADAPTVPLLCCWTELNWNEMNWLYWSLWEGPLRESEVPVAQCNTG